MVHHRGTAQKMPLVGECEREATHSYGAAVRFAVLVCAVRVSFCAKASCRLRDDIPGRRPAICGLALAHWGAESDIK